MNYVWEEVNRVGRIETGMFLRFQTYFEGKKIGIILHCFGKNNEVEWLAARIYFEMAREGVTDGLFHNVSDDVKPLLEKNCFSTVNNNTVMHAEYYADIEDIPLESPFTLGDYSL